MKMPWIDVFFRTDDDHHVDLCAAGNDAKTPLLILLPDRDWTMPQRFLGVALQVVHMIPRSADHDALRNR